MDVSLIQGRGMFADLPAMLQAVLTPPDHPLDPFLGPDHPAVAKLLGTSDTQMDHVNNAPAGHGLIKVGGAIVPFINDFPKDTELYRLMSTKPGEG